MADQPDEIAAIARAVAAVARQRAAYAGPGANATAARAFASRLEHAADALVAKPEQDRSATRFAQPE